MYMGYNDVLFCFDTQLRLYSTEDLIELLFVHCVKNCRPKSIINQNFHSKKKFIYK